MTPIEGLTLQIAGVEFGYERPVTLRTNRENQPRGLHDDDS